MTQALPTPLSQPMNRQQRRRAERAAKRAGKGKGQSGMAASPTLQQAAQRHQAGQLAEAERLYRQALQADPHDTVALHFLGALLNQAGRSEEALSLLKKASELAPDNSEVWNNLGVVQAALGRVDEAIGHYETAIKLQPGRFDPHKNLGILYFKERAFDAAVRHLEQALSAQPQNTAVMRLLGDALQGKGDRKKAVTVLRRCLALEPDDIHTIKILAFLSPTDCPPDVCLRLAKAIIDDPEAQVFQLAFQRAMYTVPPPDYRPEIDQALAHCIHRKFIPHQKLSTISAQQIILGYRAAQAGTTAQDIQVEQMRAQINSMLGNELLISVLENLVNTSVPLELFLTLLRRSLLFSLLESPQADARNMRFLAAFAQQCHHNSFVFYADSDETSAIDRLEEELNALLAEQPRPCASLEAKLMLYGLYRPVNRLLNHSALAEFGLEQWSPEFRSLIQTVLIDRVEEAKLKATITKLTAIDDDVSQAVREQYEENPYPRWISLPRLTRAPLSQHMRNMFPDFEPPDFLSETVEVLVAGCGTGQHPIGTASMLENGRVLAVDLSLASLAYAKRMAKRLGVENISFQQGDILALGNLERQFPAIECAGVLHHMEDPDAGLASLVKVLKPGGMLRLGLYSELARRDVVEARKNIADLGLAPTRENIRHFRHLLLTGQQMPGSNLTSFNDFFDLDGFRDLAFHVQEHRFTLARLREFLDAQDLKFLGFLFPDASVFDVYKEMFPEDSLMCDLERWQQFEEARPYTFLGMYEFWCQKPF